jgi:hypothetical protein
MSVDEMIELNVIGGADDFPVVNRAGLIGSITDALSLIEAERDEAIAETWRQIEGANRQFAVQNSIVHQITDERDKLREALRRESVIAANTVKDTGTGESFSAVVRRYHIKHDDILERFPDTNAGLAAARARAETLRNAPAIHPTDNDHGVGR